MREGSRDKVTICPHFVRTRLACAYCPGVRLLVHPLSEVSPQDSKFLGLAGQMGSLPTGARLWVLPRLIPSQGLVHWLQEFGKERKSQRR